MVQDLIPGTLIALAVVFPLHSTPISSTQPGFQMVYETTKSQGYTVVEGDSLGSIAEHVYGNPMYWTTLWNDNEWIADPSAIEKGWSLTIRDTKPESIELLKSNLLQKLVHVHEDEKKSVPTASPLPVLALTSQNHSGSGPLNDTQIQFLGSCEAGMDPQKNTGNGYYGAFQFSYGTWKSMGTAYERADLAPLDIQIDAVQRLLQRSSIFTQFPACARKMQGLGII